MSDSQKNVGRVLELAICPVASQPMVSVSEIEAIIGAGFKGDRYSTGEGSYNRGEPGRRQVTVMNNRFLSGRGFPFLATRRNMLVGGDDLEILFWLNRGPVSIGKEVLVQAVAYCDPCNRPSQLSGNSLSFRKNFLDCGGVIVAVVRGGIIKVGDLVVSPTRYSEPVEINLPS